MKNTTFIKKVWTENTGGGMMVDHIELSTGVVLAITEEAACAFINAEEASEGKPFAIMHIHPSEKITTIGQLEKEGKLPTT